MLFNLWKYLLVILLFGSSMLDPTVIFLELIASHMTTIYICVVSLFNETGGHTFA